MAGSESVAVTGRGSGGCGREQRTALDRRVQITVAAGVMVPQEKLSNNKKQRDDQKDSGRCVSTRYVAMRIFLHVALFSLITVDEAALACLACCLQGYKGK